MLKIMLDTSPKNIFRLSKRYNIEFWQLRTPLTNYALCGRPYGLDNGCFVEFRQKKWERLIKEAKIHTPIFVCLPDIVGDARRTLDLFSFFKPVTNNLPRALVIQDGIGNHSIPWEDLSAIFIGGSDEFKISYEAVNVAKTAKILKKWVHVGRVNTMERAIYWSTLADSIDGSAISKFDHRLEDVLIGIDKHFHLK